MIYVTLLKEAGPNRYRLPRQGSMNAEAIVYLNQELYRSFTEVESLRQLMDAASLPGVQDPVIGMPDIHTGFGLPIGGVMAMDASRGLVSAGAVGMDINCGVRLLKTNIEAGTLSKPVLRKLINAIVKRVPSGIGKKSKHSTLVKQHFRKLVQTGVPHLLELGFGRPEDSLYIEEGGSFTGADLSAVSREAQDRGIQLSTIGGGNHFIELGYVAEVFNAQTASLLGLEPGMLTVLIHTGSRGFGHQICTDYSSKMLNTATKMKLIIPTSGLAAVPIKSPLGESYLAAMACAVNFAFCNRQWITDDVRKSFASVLGGEESSYDLGLVYDVAHNIAKFEIVNNKKLLIHRKGAVRALPAGHPGNPPPYRITGHPIIIPGSMGTSSYVMLAGDKVVEAFYSVNHGAGRVLSRRAARREIDLSEFKISMKDILILGRNHKAYIDEAPQAYKDIDAVIDTFVEIGFTQKVARLVPLAVIKGEER
ncbi:MAG TPA: RtcB family protein [Firmicutes bacterium]|nr:RtcB family protein [Bacillota bacterium]